MESKYISIAKYAKMNGISKSYAYSLINQPENAIYIKESNGRKMVREDMPVDFGNIPEGNKDIPEDTSFQLSLEGFGSAETPIESDKKPEESDNKPEEKHGIAISADNELLEYYKKRIEELEAIIKDKDLQLQNNTTTIALLLEKQQELTEKALQVATQAQYLQALPQKKQGFFRRLLGGGRKSEM